MWGPKPPLGLTTTFCGAVECYCDGPIGPVLVCNRSLLAQLAFFPSALTLFQRSVVEHVPLFLRGYEPLYLDHNCPILSGSVVVSAGHSEEPVGQFVVQLSQVRKTFAVQ
jgi:hypothetical protein